VLGQLLDVRILLGEFVAVELDTAQARKGGRGSRGVDDGFDAAGVDLVVLQTEDLDLLVLALRQSLTKDDSAAGGLASPRSCSDRAAAGLRFLLAGCRSAPS
jgi:hypothetical protein